MTSKAWKYGKIILILIENRILFHISLGTRFWKNKHSLLLNITLISIINTFLPKLLAFYKSSTGPLLYWNVFLRFYIRNTESTSLNETFDLNSKILNKNGATYFYYFWKTSPPEKYIVIGNIYPAIIGENPES